MKQTVTFSDFCDAFKAHDRDNFSYAGLQALFDYLEEYEAATGEEVELDVIALCVEYSEYKNLKDFQAQYSDDYATVQDLEEQTQVIYLDDDTTGESGFIIVDF